MNPQNMETVEDIKKDIAIAQSLSVEAKNNSEDSESDKDASLQQMGALLASNCQKLCIGPSFHFYTSEKSPDCLKEEMYESKGPRSQGNDDDDDDDEFETVIYNGPDAPYERVENTNPQNKTTSPDVKLEIMNARLAAASAEDGGLSSQHFFADSPGATSVDSPSEGVIRGSGTDSGKRNPKSHFASPTANFKGDASESHADKTDHQLERFEILDDTNSDETEAEFVEWSKKYIESKGFCLGIQPGNFFKDRSRPYFYVKLPHRSNYEVIVTNNNQVPCDLDLHLNGQHVAALRLPAGTTRSIDGPQYSEHSFKLFRIKDAPPEKKVTEGAKVNGLVKAVFTPCKIGNSRLRSVSEPFSSGTRLKDFLDLFDDPKDAKTQRSFTIASTGEDKLERSLDISQVAEGVTLLQGVKKEKNYVLAPEMETDPSKRVTLQLRLIASLVEEVDSTEGEIYDLEPPLLPTRK